MRGARSTGARPSATPQAKHRMQTFTAPVTVSESSPRKRSFSVYGAALVLALLLLCAVLLWYGWDFYWTDVQARVDHEEFRSLSPSGPVGHGYGIMGTALILTNLLYLVRRRLARMHLGSMRLWLDIHVFTGLFGSALVVFHSAFQLRTPIATVTAVSLGVVVLTGLIGRYFYALTPENNRAQLENALVGMDALWPALSVRLAELTEGFHRPVELARPSLLSALTTIPAWLAQARMRRRHILEYGKRALASVTLEPHLEKLVRIQLKVVASASTAQVKAHAGGHLLRTWRGLHRFMALLMVVSVTVHIGVAWYFGFRWIFTE